MDRKRIVVLVAGSLVLLWTAAVSVSCDASAGVQQAPSDVEIEAEPPTPDLEATSAAEEIAAGTAQAEQTATAQVQGTVDAIASATAQVQATQTALAVKLVTAQVKATQTALAIRIETATARAKVTNTPTPTSTPTQTNTPPPLPTSAYTNTPVANEPSSDMIVRSPGEKSPGDHGVSIQNKTGATVTIIMYGDPFNYTFYIPDGNYKIFLRPGFYTFTYYSCGGVNSGSGTFNSNWVWEFWCS